ncbi:transcription elongation factor TFIIS-like [Cynara cardunculus var. scolymus]|uniref:Transcription elongation factor n=1 Tax=Cynara cardunculus var. scolymus TaxID=59895 RepID=A0A118K640_CYNCS|nr:transcription elongation factor TFIIS-like [Cynara cardunculus var. scolymus]KVI10038.1 Transcription elongation factor S-II, central domain-containing protein [Cynara cardunculus var. scolymus]
METELKELFDAAKKAADAAAVVGGGADSSPEEDRCIDALRALKKFPVNYQILVSTQVGKRLRQLTKHPRRKIQSLAAELVEIWKNIIVEETLKNKKNGSLDAKESLKSEHVAETSDKKVQRVNSIKVEKHGHSGTHTSEKKVNVVKVEKREHTKVEHVTKQENKQTSDANKPNRSNNIAPPKLTSLVYCKDPVRDKIRELLSEALCKVPGEVEDDLRDEVDGCDPYRVAVSVESAMFEKWGRSNGAQKFKYRSIMFNIKDPKNPDFRRKVLLGHVMPERILELTPEEMASTERQMENVKIKEKALFDCERGGPPKATTDQFKCGRCQKRKCTYYQLQTRSADEPMTTFVTCVNCDNHWKFC